MRPRITATSLSSYVYDVAAAVHGVRVLFRSMWFVSLGLLVSLESCHCSRSEAAVSGTASLTLLLLTATIRVRLPLILVDPYLKHREGHLAEIGRLYLSVKLKFYTSF